MNVCDINGAEVEPVDVITFGSPCQDLSVAGKRAGIQDGIRSNLFFQAVRIIKEMRESTNGNYPKYAVWENVPGAFSSNKGRDFHAVLEALCSVCDGSVSIPEPYDERGADRLVWLGAGEIVGDGYSVAWRTLDAQYWGVPQRRKRIYLVADFTGGRAGEILFKSYGLRGNLPQSNEQGQGAAAHAVGSVDGSVGVDGLTAFSFDSLSSNSMKSSNPISGCRAVEIAKCIDTTYPDPAKNQGGVAVVECLGFDMYNQASTGDKTRTLKTPAGGDDLPVVVLNDQGGSSINVESEEISPTLRANGHQHEPVIALQGNGIDRADTAGCNGCGWREGECYTLNTIGRPAVCYDARGNGDGETVNTMCFSIQRSDEYKCSEIASTQSARQYKSATDLVVEKRRKYIIRRLTPTECARLQGFPDWWGELAPYNPADADFWESVRKTYAEINGKAYKPCKNLKKWYEGLHTDSAEYKMWGNGIALPCAENVLHGIADLGAKTLGSLFDGSGGFPLAGLINGITPLWSSEIEPYPIAVTMSRF